MTDLTADVLTTKEGLAGRLRLNRPKALHSLNRQMVRDMAGALIEWRDDPDVRIILIDHAEGRGFCAGGDVVDIARTSKGMRRRRAPSSSTNIASTTSNIPTPSRASPSWTG